MIKRDFAAPDLESVYASEDLLSAFDVDYIAPEALLFQTGYLTIAEEDEVDDYPHYRLRYPNREVRRGLNESLLNALAPRWRAAGDRGALRRSLAQLRARRYADKYRASTRAVHLIGVEISGKSRDIMVFETESA